LMDAGAPPEAVQEMFMIIQKAAQLEEETPDIRQQDQEGKQQPNQGGQNGKSRSN